jgi:hypothetical protein
MKQILIAAAVLVLSSTVQAKVFPYEAVALVVQVLECHKAGKDKIDVRFHNGNRYSRWAPVRDVRQTSGTEFEFLIENKQDNGFQWIPADNFISVRCAIAGVK